MSKYFTIKKDDTTQTIGVSIESFPMLYKYQSVNDYSVRALINCELWGTVPTNFNDPYDTVVCYSKFLLKKTIAEKLTKKRFLSYSVFFKTKSKVKIIDKIIEAVLSNFNDTFRQQYCISSFSEVFDSEIMWGHYANCAKGFVVAYKGEEIKKVAENNNSVFIEMLRQLKPLDIDFSNLEDDGLLTLVPVIYSNGKYNIDKIAINTVEIILEFYDSLCVYKTELDVCRLYQEYFDKINKNYMENKSSRDSAFYSALSYKNKAWAYEKEWRVWSYNNNQLKGQTNDPHVLIGNIKPVAIYLGERITSYDENILLSIAKEELQIPVYKMRTKMFKNTCRLKAELIYKAE